MCADEKYKFPRRVTIETAWHNLFRRYTNPKELKTHDPQFTIMQMPNFHANSENDGTNSEVFVIINFGKKIVHIGSKS